MSCTLNMKSYELSLNADNHEIKKCLHYLTDDNFNGDNGSDCYVEIEIDDEVQLVSMLDNYMLRIDDFTELDEFIFHVLKSCYCEDSDEYEEYSIYIKAIYDTLIIVIAYTY